MDDTLKELQEIFSAEAEQILDDLEVSLLQLESTGYSEDLINKLFRLMHNFKGSSRSVGFTAIADLAHKAEDVLTQLKSRKIEVSNPITTSLLKTTDSLREGLVQTRTGNGAPDFSPLIDTLAAFLSESKPTEPENPHASMLSQGFGFFEDEKPTAAIEVKPHDSKTVLTEVNQDIKPKTTPKAEEDFLRVSTTKMDQLLNLVGELVVNQEILRASAKEGQRGNSDTMASINAISKIVGDVQSLSMSLRLVPVKPLFQKLRRAVRDVASELGKVVDYIDAGEHVELDKTVVDRIVDPLTHMVRNAVDHGVDSPEERRAAGKPERPTIKLSAATSDDRVLITMSDDGRGLNKAKIIAIAIKRGIISERDAKELSIREINALIFRPGFSTKDSVSAISGRGVGMEVVQRAVEDMKGQIDIDSEEGVGTTFRITLPLSLSIIGGMVVRVQGQSYIIPMSQLLETIELGKYRIESSTGTGLMLKLREEVIPVYHLRQPLRLATRPEPTKSKRPAVVTSLDNRKVSFEVDEIVGQQQVVLKKLGPEFLGLPGLIGGAVLSSGDPGIVISLHELIKRGNLYAS